jgi:hypothetical protein
MEKFAFITRHAPTAGQIAIAEQAGIELVPIGDRDAFSITVADIEGAGVFDGVIVVHPAAAMRLASAFVIGVFENANRAAEGEKPSFEAVNLHLYDLVD